MRRMMRCWWIALLCLTIWLAGTGGASAANGSALAEYKAPDGIVITSFSPAWTDQAKLKELHHELLQNTHGDEIKLLNQIEIYDDYPRGKGVAGQYIFQTISTVLSFKQKMQPGKIELYGGSEHQTVASFAHTLSHEYGHHVTHYYTLQTDQHPLTDAKYWKDTTYARMRGLTNDERVGVTDVEHRWQIAEIAAEDYVQLFGSPLAKAVTPFQSRVEQAMRGEEPAAVTWSGSMYNVQPQENLLLPLASEVPGLYDFFYKQMQGRAGNYKPPAKPKLSLASYSKQGEVGNQLDFTWSEVGENKNYTYTLVTYKDDDLLAEPIVTRTAKDAHEARYGPVVMRKGQYIYTYQEPSAKGVRHFKLYAFDEHGWVSQSPVLTVDMANPSKVTESDNKVVPVPVEAPSANGDMFTSMMPEFLQPVLGFLGGVLDVLKSLIEWIASFLQTILG